jgi:hypothetical protein
MFRTMIYHNFSLKKPHFALDISQALGFEFFLLTGRVHASPHAGNANR